MGRSAADRVRRRGGAYEYVRRVPVAVAHLDRRVLVRKGLGSDLAAAVRLAVRFEAELEAYWAALAGGAPGADARRRHEAAVARARLEGFAYRPADELAGGRLADLVDRMLALEGRRADRPAAAALAGLAGRPRLTLTAALAAYLDDLSAAELAGKRPDQVRRWRGPRQLAVDNLVAVLGEDRALEELTREDARAFRDWWVARIDAGGAGRNAANKQLMHIRRMLRVVAEELGLPRNAAFDRLSIRETRRQRPSLTRSFVEATLLPGLAGVSAELAAAVMLAAETGMGAEEITSLTAADIRLEADVPHVEVVVREGALQKTPWRARAIPLVGVSLAAARARPEGLAAYAGRPASLSAAANKALRARGLLPSPAHSLYSLRHAFQDRLIAAEAPERLQAELMGHKLARERYGEGPSLDQARRWLARIAYRVE